MKQIYIYATIFTLLLISGCIKTNSYHGTSALNIVNAVNYSDPMVTNFSKNGVKGTPSSILKYYSTANQIAYGNSWESGSYIGETFLSISQISDTTNVLWNGEINLEVGSIHSLFFCGDTATIDTFFTTDIIPYYRAADSLSGIRFVNLVKGSLPMSVNIQGNSPSLTEFNNLGYKQMSIFKPYNFNSSGPGSYSFEIRDQNSDSILTVFSWSNTLQQSNTVFITGSSSLGINAYQLNNF